MTVIRFPLTPGAGSRSPRPIYVRAPSHEDLPYATRKICLGYTRDEAEMRFCEGGLNLDIEAKTFTLTTLPKWLKVQVMSQFDVFIGTGQPLSEVEEDARQRLGPDPYKYGQGLRKTKRKR
jgi:hypothetical protein